MSKIQVVVCSSMVVLWGFGFSGEVRSQDRLGEFVSESRPPTELTVEDRIESVLDAQLKSPLDFTELPLKEILSILQEDYDIPIILDLAALDELAISPDTETTINFRNISLRNALDLLLRQPGLEDLTFYINHEVVLVTTKDQANSFLTTKVYRVDDLGVYLPVPKGASAWTAYSPLMDTATSCVEKSSWQENGKGDGEIQLVAPGILVVSQTPRVHSEIEKLFKRIRKVRNEISASAADEAQSKLETQGFHVDQGLAKLSEEAKKLIVASITESVDWKEQTEDNVWVRFVGNRILVRHRADVLQQVQEVIGKMGLAAPHACVGTGGGGFGGGGFGGGGGGFF